MTESTAAAALRNQLERVAELHATRPLELAEDLIALAHWQASRLRRTYADLAHSERYAAAADFFFDDLYGPHDFAKRDADLQRVYPMMVRILPMRIVSTVAAAMEVNALTQELDREMVTMLRQSGPVDDALSVERYAQAYRCCGTREQRERQIELIVHVGCELDAVVNLPFIYPTLKLLRRPARMAKLTELQDFLERGFTAFRGMNGADEFLRAVTARETAIMRRLFAGDPKPFDVG